MVRVPVHHLKPGEMTLEKEASRYVARVLRVAEGQTIRLFDPEHRVEADAFVVAIERTGVRCRIAEVSAALDTNRRPITVLQAVGKGDKFDAVVRDATELGATQIVAVETARGVVRIGDRAEHRLQRWRKIAEEAARQCGRADTPALVGPTPWGDALRGATSEGSISLCLWERAIDSIGPVLATLAPMQPVTIAVGSEGGLEIEETNLARSLGYAVVSLGPLILRTETVATAVLGAVLVLSAVRKA